MKTKRILSVFVLSVFTFMLIGCTSTSNSSSDKGDNQNNTSAEPVTIRVANVQMSTVDALEKLLPEYEKQTGVKVQFENLPQEELHSKAEFALASASPQYDVIMMDMMYTSQQARAGWLKDITSEVEALEDYDDFMPKFVDAFRLEDKIYGLPLYGETSTLAYNKEMFEAVGLKEAPKTLEELEEYAKLLTTDGKYGIALRGMAGEGMNVYIWAGFYNAYGGKWIEDGKPVINSPEAIKATELYARLVQNYAPPGGANFSWDQVQLSMQQGTVAMIIDSTNFAPRLEDPENSKVVGKVGYAPVPAGPEGSYPSIYTAGYVVSEFSEHAKEAFEFIEWATSKEIQLKTALEGLRADATRQSVWDNQEYQDKYNYDGWVETTSQSMNEADPDYRPRIAEWKRLGNRIGIAISEVLAGADVETALNKAQDEVLTYFK